jgi:metal-responsive CopG/Arc/MetJ family transcriptional regulator
MRLHIVLGDDLVAEIDKRAGQQTRSEFIARVVRQALDTEARWDDIEAALGTLEGTEHEWDADPAAWVRDQRANRRGLSDV